MKKTQDKKILKYVVPFLYLGKYTKVLSLLNNKGFIQIESDNSESDLYKHIKEEFNGNDNAVGVQLVKSEITKLLLINKNGNYDKFRLVNPSVYLFKNNIGFFNYEIVADGIKSSKELVEFQNVIKELNRSNNNLFKECKISNETRESNPSIKGSAYFPFLIGNWIAESLRDINVDFLPRKKMPIFHWLRIMIKHLNQLMNMFIS